MKGITIDEAIKIQVAYEQELMTCLPITARPAIELGIEALKFYAKYKWVMKRFFHYLLPGEIEK